MGANSVSIEVFLPGLQMATLSLGPHVAFPLCTGTPNVFSSFYKDTGSIELGPHLISHLILITSLTALSPNKVTLGAKNSTNE